MIITISPFETFNFVSLASYQKSSPALSVQIQNSVEKISPTPKTLKKKPWKNIFFFCWIKRIGINFLPLSIPCDLFKYEHRDPSKSQSGNSWGMEEEAEGSGRSGGDKRPAAGEWDPVDSTRRINHRGKHAMRKEFGSTTSQPLKLAFKWRWRW